MTIDINTSRGLFHSPYTNNNYRVYVRNDIDPTLNKKRLIKLYSSLNEADVALKHWFEKTNDQLGLPSVNNILQEWNKKLKRNQNLAGVYYAMAIINEFDKIGINVLHLLRKEQHHLIDNFKQLPEELLTVSRINQCISFDEIPMLFHQLCSNVLIDPKIRMMVERVETLLTPPKEQLVKYPTLIIYLDNKALEIQQQLDYLLEKLNNHFLHFFQKTMIDNTFADPWNSFVNVTHGFKLHKVYLSALGVIDHVYSKETAFAYRISDDNFNHKRFGRQPIKSLISDL